MFNTIKKNESAELKRLVDAWVKNGGVVKKMGNEPQPLKNQKLRGCIKQ